MLPRDTSRSETFPDAEADPRWMDLHKLWLADKPQRNVRTKDKDRRQGEALLDIILTAIPFYPRHADFRALERPH
jgi:hypothetical protein